MTHKQMFQFGYRRHADQGADTPAHHAVVIVGAGPVGMTLALDLAQRGIRSVLLDDADRIGEGSRAICFAKRTLEIFDRLGVADRMLAKGVVWQKGRVFLGHDEIYGFDLLPEGGHKMPAFINLQQYYVEQYLVEAIADHDLIDLRWRNKVSAIATNADSIGAIVTINTPDGPYRVQADWLICCDGAKSPCRAMMGLDFAGEMFEDQFLIADVKMTADFPTERWFWFSPPFHSGQSALLHRQPDDVWRIDLQLSPDADADLERRPEQVSLRIARMLGHNQFKLEWVSVYRFQCRRLERFVHNHVIFAGDSAHQVSPFGARGANSGIQDADNLGWKLAAVLEGRAGAALIDSYEVERGQAADENIAHSTRSTDFIAPRTRNERLFRNAALQLAATADFAKRFVNSGRLSLPTVYTGKPDHGEWNATAQVGGALPDAPVIDAVGKSGWLLNLLGNRQPGNGQSGNGFTVLHFGTVADGVSVDGAKLVIIDFAQLSKSASALFEQRFDARPGTTYVIRPDQHICARFRTLDPTAVAAAVRCAHS